MAQILNDASGTFPSSQGFVMDKFRIQTYIDVVTEVEMQEALRVNRLKSKNRVDSIPRVRAAAKNVSKSMNSNLRKVSFNEVPSFDKELEEIIQTVVELTITFSI